MSAPQIVIIGRPNVGKSTLFNQISGKRVAITADQPGVTRDRIVCDVEVFGKKMRFIDTGGMMPKPSNDLERSICYQAERALEGADLILLIVDAMVGVDPWDQWLAKQLLREKKRIFLIVNKVDNPERELLMHNFHKLGISDIFPLSATHKIGLGDLLEKIGQEIFSTKPSRQVEGEPKIALIGKVNAGKSTLLNQLLGTKRSIASPQAGTTRDRVQESIHSPHGDFCLVDTAGLCPPSKDKESVDAFSRHQSQRAIEEAHVCLFLIDAEKNLSSQDEKILRMIEKEGKACILLFNKWDLIHKERMEHYEKDFRKRFSFLSHVPILFISAEFGRNVEQILPLLSQVIARGKARIPTPLLNRGLQEILNKHAPRRVQGRRLRIYYAMQAQSFPPTLLLFVNAKSLLYASYERYIRSELRKRFDLSSWPLLLICKQRKS